MRNHHKIHKLPVNLDLHLIQGSLVEHKFASFPNSIAIRLAILALLTRVPRTQTTPRLTCVAKGRIYVLVIKCIMARQRSRQTRHDRFDEYLQYSSIPKLSLFATMNALSLRREYSKRHFYCSVWNTVALKSTRNTITVKKDIKYILFYLFVMR